MIISLKVFFNKFRSLAAYKVQTINKIIFLLLIKLVTQKMILLHNVVIFLNILNLNYKKSFAIFHFS